MRAVIESARTDSRRVAVGIGRIPLSRAAPTIVLAGLTAAAVFAGGGSSDATIPWVGGAALAAAAGAVAATLAGVLEGPRLAALGAAGVALFTSFVLWNGLTAVWSVDPARSWSYFNRGLVYLAFLGLGLYAGALVRRAPARIAAAFALLAAAAVVWALCGKVFPALNPDGGRIARLREPVGYWNALALLLAMAMPVALAFAAGPRKRSVRTGAVLLLYVLVVGMLLTYSRSGVLAAAAGVALWLAVCEHRAAMLAALLASVPVGAAVALWAFRQPGIASDNQAYDTRVQDGAELGVALLLGALAVAGLAVAAGRLDGLRLPATLAERTRHLRGPAALGLIVLLGVAFAADIGGARNWVGRQADEFRNPPTDLVQQDPSRLTTLNSNNRWEWWKEAWQGFRWEPLTGSGAGTFETTHRRLRTNWILVTEPHNEALQFLAETGAVGFLLAAGAAIACLVAVARGVRRLRGPERQAGAALAVGLVVYAMHSLVDWDWDFLAVTAPALAIFGALLAAGRPPRSARRRSLLAVAVPLPLAAALASLLLPWLAVERVDRAYAALARQDAAEAVRTAELAESLNPLAFEPLLAQADAQTALGDVEGARSTLVEAVERLPSSWETWYELGRFEFEVAGRPDLAINYLRRSEQLDRAGPAFFLIPEVVAALEQGG
jgi:O-antigen ligase